MISRKSAMAVGKTYEETFYNYHSAGQRRQSYRTVNNKGLYDFLYEHEYETWFCNAARLIDSSSTAGTRPMREFVMRLHTGETVAEATKDWSWKQRELLGQRLLADMAKDILGYLQTQGSGDSDYTRKEYRQKFADLKHQLELDGYIYRDGQLLKPEKDALNIEESTGVLHNLVNELGLSHKERIFEHLKLTEEHYVEKRWSDSISNTRKVFEGILQEVAMTHHLKKYRVPLNEDTYKSAREVRDYLEKEELLETKEKEALNKVYGVISETGSHPYMAENDQARLMRDLALTFSQFVMLRLRGFINSLLT